jgi:hypothetical protein
MGPRQDRQSVMRMMGEIKLLLNDKDCFYSPNCREEALQHHLGSLAGPANASSPNAWRMRSQRPCSNHSS